MEPCSATDVDTEWCCVYRAVVSVGVVSVKTKRGPGSLRWSERGARSPGAALPRGRYGSLLTGGDEEPTRSPRGHGLRPSSTLGRRLSGQGRPSWLLDVVGHGTEGCGHVALDPDRVAAEHGHGSYDAASVEVRGTMIMQALVDEMTYEPGQGTRVRLRRRLGGPGARRLDRERRGRLASARAARGPRRGVRPALLPGVAAALESAPGPQVRLDLAAVTFFDSSGVRLVDHCLRLADRRDLQVSRVAPVGSMVRRVLEITLVALDLVVDEPR